VRSGRRGGLLAACCALLLLGALAAPAAPAAAQGAPERDGGLPTLGLDVAALDGVVPADGTLRIRAQITNSGLLDRTDLRLVATVHRRAIGRIALQQAIEDGIVGTIVHPFVADLGTVPSRGSRTVELAQTVEELGLARSGLEGVYPLRLQLLADGDVAAEVTTAMVLLPDVVVEPLNLSLLVPVAYPPARDAEGVVRDGTLLRAIEEDGDLALTAAALRDARGLGASLAVDAHTLNDLAAIGAGYSVRTDGEVTAVPASHPSAAAARTVLGDLRAAIASRAVAPLPLPYAQADLVALVRHGLGAEVARHLDEGRAGVAAVTDAAVPVDVLWPLAGLDAATHAAVREEGVDTVVLGEDALGIGDSGDFTPPPVRRLRGTAAGQTVLVPDPWLEVVLGRRGGDDPVVTAQQIVAEVASTYFEFPGTGRRGILVAPPPGTPIGGPVLAALAGTLADAPFLRTMPVPRLPARVDDAGRTAVLAYDARERRAELPSTYAAMLTGSRRALGSLAGVLEQGAALPSRFDRLLLQSASVHYRGEELATGRELLRTVSGTVQEIYAGVDVLDAPPVTLTAVEGELPVTIRSTADLPLRVRLALQTARFEVEGGPVRELVLEPGTAQVLTFRVRSLTPGGTSPIQVVVSDVDGDLVLGSGTVVVRSTAFSRVALGVTVGAGTILVLWLLWGAVRRRRSGHGPAVALASAARAETVKPRRRSADDSEITGSVPRPTGG
jgi:hypothetical protein